MSRHNLWEVLLDALKDPRCIGLPYSPRWGETHHLVDYEGLIEVLQDRYHNYDGNNQRVRRPDPEIDMLTDDEARKLK